MRIIKRSIIGSLLAVGLVFAGATSASANYVGQTKFNYETPGMVTMLVWDGSSWNAVQCWPNEHVK